jgi:NADH-quinone oxidoreductase subunit L
MLLGTLAITGVGVLGVFGFRRLLLEGRDHRERLYGGTSTSGFAFAIGLFAALLTSFYSWRLIFLTFFGKPRWAGVRAYPACRPLTRTGPGQTRPPGQEHSGDHRIPKSPARSTSRRARPAIIPHESPWTMLVPLGVLSIGAILAGMAFHHPFIESTAGTEFWRGSLAFDEHLMEEIHHAPLWVKLAPAAVMIIGFLIRAAGLYPPHRPSQPLRGPVPRSPRVPAQQMVFRRDLSLRLRRAVDGAWPHLLKGGDEKVIDRFGPNGAARW